MYKRQLVLQGLVVVGVALAGGLLDNPLNIVVGDVVGLGLGNGVLELGVGGGIGAAALLDRHRQLPADFGENLSPLAVGLLFLALNIIPFGVSGHG